MQQQGVQAGRGKAAVTGAGVGPATNFLPSFCSIQAVFAVVLTGELLAVVLTLAALERLGQFLDQLSLVSLLVQWVALGSAALLCLLRPWLRRLDNRLAGLLAWLVLQAVTLAVVAAAIGLGARYLPALGQGDGGPGLLIRALGISAISGLLVLHYLYLQYLWRRQEAAENQARLQALYSRIRPHFLFNSMNTIASLTRSDPLLAEELVMDLADLFRVALGDAQRLSTLGEELALARQYLHIEAHRLGERLRVEWDLRGLPEAARMPPLILQPLLENAVYHGIEPAAAGGRIQISGRYRRRRINLSIRNSLPARLDASHRQGNRLALENIRQRLDALYEGRASLSEARVDGEHQVRLVLPHPWSFPAGGDWAPLEAGTA